MNGADKLCDVLLVNGIDVCFANPGTSEMHFVAALDRKPRMRCVLGLFEGVVTGAADGYGRMAGKPAATLLHLGPGLANGLANLHNARRAHTPIVNVVGDHATYHLRYDAPLTSDIESLARPMSAWVGRARSADDIRKVAEAAYINAVARRGAATMILPADAAWNDVADDRLAPVTPPSPAPASIEQIRAAAAALSSARRATIILGSTALGEDAIKSAGQIAAATGATLFSQHSARHQRGAGRVPVKPIPSPIDATIAALAPFDVAICIGARRPVGFFAYPGKPSEMLSPECKVIELAGVLDDLPATIAMLCEELGAGRAKPELAGFNQKEITDGSGTLTAEAVGRAVARRLPENAIICDESVTSGRNFAQLAYGLPPHDHLPLTGGSIGIGIPLSVGAAIACPDRKVILLQADGSGMYTVQGLWTQARENLDVVTIVYSNRAYAILQGEMRNVGVKELGQNARSMLDLDRPNLDWCRLATGMGVEAGRAATVEDFTCLLDAALAHRGPFLIEAVI